MRRRLELGGGPLAFADAAFAVAIIALLALTMMIGVHAFNELAEHQGDAATLPLGAFFNGIAKDPAAPEYWWVYALLLSTMIPSLVNLAIAGTALTRGYRACHGFCCYGGSRGGMCQTTSGHSWPQV